MIQEVTLRLNDETGELKVFMGNKRSIALLETVSSALRTALAVEKVREHASVLDQNEVSGREVLHDVHEGQGTRPEDAHASTEEGTVLLPEPCS